MKKRRLLLTALAVTALAIPAKVAPRVAASPGDTPQDDPVVKARASRALAQGIDERDLPPVPKSLVEPLMQRFDVMGTARAIPPSSAMRSCPSTA